MTHHDDLDRELVTWFSDDAARPVPAGLLGAIEATSRTLRQQPGWLVTLRGESMGLGATGRQRAKRLALVGALAALAALLAVLIAGRQQPTPFHTGLLAFVRDGDVYLANPDGSNARVALHQDGIAFATVAWAPRGTELAVDGDSGVVVLDTATGSASFVGGSNPAWSPDGRAVAVLDPSSRSSVDAVLRIVDVASMSTSKAYPVQTVGGLSWSPNGRWLAANGGYAGNAVERIDVATGEVVEIDAASGLLDARREIIWSPDSRHVAFVRNGPSGPECGEPITCALDVFVAEADGSEVVRANESRGRADRPSWSPDGEWLALRSLAVGPSGLIGSGIHVVRPDGTDERAVVDAAVQALTWAPEGDRLLFAVGASNVAAIWETTLSGEAHSMGLSVDASFARYDGAGFGFAWQQLAGDRSASGLPSVAPFVPSPTLEVVTPAPGAPADPSATWPTIALDDTSQCDPETLAAANGVATAVAHLCSDTDSSYSGSWSPNGRSYVFGHEARPGAWDFVVLRWDGSSAFQLSVPSVGGGTVWAPAGSRFGFVVDGDVMVVRQDAAGTWSAAKVTVGGAIDIAWSPDGRSLAVAISDGTVQIGDANGAGLHSIGSVPLPIRWAPDGSSLVFVRDGNAWVVKADGSEQRNVSNLPLGGAVDALWSPDGKWIAVASSRGLLLTAPDGSHRRSLDFGGDSLWFNPTVWSPDAATLAVVIAGDSPRVLLIGMDDSAIVRIDDAESPVWSPDGKYLLVVALDRAGNPPTRSVAVMNGDGSGWHELVSVPDLGQMVWVR